jgi:2-keto-4-pentenoate hydratase/2-oxohepta-3-ene-1,7-dioic acid hydratase in catechol pathway
MLSTREKIATVLGRVVAVFLATGLSVVAAGTIAGVELWQSFVMAGIGGVATVVEGLSRAYLKDGDLSLEEINSVFGNAEAKLQSRNNSE